MIIIQAHPFVSIKQANAEIETLTQVSLCPTQIREFLVKLGIKRRKAIKDVKLVQIYAEQLGIELLFLPPYSPNFNLIERLRKFVRKKCLYTKYYDNFEKFQRAISECLETASTTNEDELKSLLTLRFQTFDKSSFMPV